jgi:alcohol dehydrogenase (cytochrome c)
MQPYAGGGSNWNPTTYNPQTGFVYVMGIERNFGYARRPEEYTAGRRYTGGNNVSPLGSPITNTFTAMDSRTNKIVWQKRTAGENNYGALSTAGGLVFTGQVDGNMVAMDARTGDPLWKFQVGWGISAPPMTYSVDGVQYVTVAAGGNRGGLTTTDGDAVWTFALNGTIDEVASPPAIQTKIELAGALVKIGDPVGRPQDIGGDQPFVGTIDTGDYLFMPARVSVAVGTTLTWQNSGNVIHTATENKQTWDTGDIPAGESRSITFDTPGTYSYTCNPHPWMFGQIVVQ